MCTHKKKNNIELQIYEETELPKKGWIQGCILCKMPTSKTQYYKSKKVGDLDYHIFMHLCKDCVNYKKMENLHNRKIIDTYLEKYYLIPCRSNTPDTSL